MTRVIAPWYCRTVPVLVGAFKVSITKASTSTFVAQKEVIMASITFEAAKVEFVKDWLPSLYRLRRFQHCMMRLPFLLLT